MNVQLLTIDPQNDFCDPSGSLFVSGADKDMERLAKMILRLENKLDDIHVTLDSHRTVQIFHPIFWKDANGKNPNPFTLISVDDVEKGRWVPTNPAFAKWCLHYVKELAKNKKYALCIWPEHCLIGSTGHLIYPVVFDALRNWEKKNFGNVNYVTKGSNPKTEHYGGLRAEIEDPADPTTMLNTAVIDVLKKADIVILSGEARSHCLATTVGQIADEFGDDNIKKLVLLEDTTSDVPGFEKNGIDFVDKMVKKGMQKVKSTEFLK